MLNKFWLCASWICLHVQFCVCVFIMFNLIKGNPLIQLILPSFVGFFPIYNMRYYVLHTGIVQVTSGSAKSGSGYEYAVHTMISPL